MVKYLAFDTHIYMELNILAELRLIYLLQAFKGFSKNFRKFKWFLAPDWTKKSISQ